MNQTPLILLYHDGDLFLVGPATDPQTALESLGTATSPSLVKAGALPVAYKKVEVEGLTLTKRCSGCKHTQLATAFCKDRSRPDGLSAYCRGCQKLMYRRKKGKG